MASEEDTHEEEEAPSQPRSSAKGPVIILCPRCGGKSDKRIRRSFLNPFLSKVPDEVTCEDCGLDFDPKSGRGPWGGRE